MNDLIYLGFMHRKINFEFCHQDDKTGLIYPGLVNKKLFPKRNSTNKYYRNERVLYYDFKDKRIN